MPADPSMLPPAGGVPPDEWLVLVNRQALAVRLISTTVHDANNILQVVSGAAEVLALDPTPAAVTKRTTTIVAQSAAATALLHALTAFVRADDGPGAGAGALAVASQVLALRQHAIRKGRITATAGGEETTVALARHRLQQVLLNLVLNAEQALAGRSDGTIRVEVAAGQAVTVSVTDNGPGLPGDIERTMAAWPPRPGGATGALGLGLTVSRMLVAQAGGSLTCGTAPEGGARVIVSLPRLRR